MATRRIVPSLQEDGVVLCGFSDGERQLTEWERPYSSNSLVREVTLDLYGVAKETKDLTYQEWLEKVWSPMQVRKQFVGEVIRQRIDHFRPFR